MADAEASSILKHSNDASSLSSNCNLLTNNNNNTNYASSAHAAAIATLQQLYQLTHHNPVYASQPQENSVQGRRRGGVADETQVLPTTTSAAAFLKPLATSPAKVVQTQLQQQPARIQIDQDHR